MIRTTVSAPLPAASLPACFELRRCYLPDVEIGPILTGEWEQRTIHMFGRTCPIPRLTRWYGEAAYTYSGIRNAPEPMPAWLHTVRQRVQEATGAEFNSCLLNYYRDGRDSLAWHSDDEPELGERPTIASLSIGASRVFAIKRRWDTEDLSRPSKTPGVAGWKLTLSDGDLLIMRGESQAEYLHAVPKTSKPVGPRINITFRTVRAVG